MRIVYFDGYCNVCNRFVDFLIRRDRRRILKFASLQGQTAEKRLPPNYTSDVNTMVFERDGEIFEKSSAAIRSIGELGGVYSLMKVFLIVPWPWRDFIYQFIADHRYLWFGKRDTCRIPTPFERAQLLD
jgi:predicted DCC family thiol-disulfide oxidoreductase YuxK